MARYVSAMHALEAEQARWPASDEKRSVSAQLATEDDQLTGPFLNSKWLLRTAASGCSPKGVTRLLGFG
jgi:hypothetical protein